jgi:hypothetical protein
MTSIWDKLRDDLTVADVNNVKHVILAVINEVEHLGTVTGILPVTAEAAKAVPIVDEVAAVADVVVPEVAEVEPKIAAIVAPAQLVNNPAPIEAPPTPVVVGEVVGYPGPIVDKNGVPVLMEVKDPVTGVVSMELNPAATPGHVSQAEAPTPVPHVDPNMSTSYQAPEPVVTPDPTPAVEVPNTPEGV